MVSFRQDDIRYSVSTGLFLLLLGSQLACLRFYNVELRAVLSRNRPRADLCDWIFDGCYRCHVCCSHRQANSSHRGNRTRSAVLRSFFIRIRVEPFIGAIHRFFAIHAFLRFFDVPYYSRSPPHRAVKTRSIHPFRNKIPASNRQRL